MYQHPPREAYSPPQISIDGTNLSAVEHFTYLYLGSVISDEATVSRDLDNHLSKASSSFGSLSKRATRPASPRNAKIQLSGPVIVPTLLYGAKTRVLYRK